MIYRILGQLTIGEDGAEPLPLPTGHRLTVLAVLLLHANRPVSREDLLRAAWGHSGVDDTQLHKCISGLRSLLAEIGRREDLITRQGFGYELRVGPDDLDRLVFERLVREAEAAGAGGQAAEEIASLRAALGLWCGPALAGVPGNGLDRLRSDLSQRRKRAAARLFDLELARGSHARIVGELHEMFGAHPSDRRLCEQLMLALYRSGHGTEALAVFERHASALAEETGAAPEAGLRHLLLAITRGDEQGIARHQTAAPRPTGPVASRPAAPIPPRQLPPAAADFIGRRDWVAEACWLLDRVPRSAVPIVVATGPGGIGKTALAVHVARQLRHYPDGQLYVELHGITENPANPTEVLAQILRALGVSDVPETRAERVALFRSLTGDRRLLLVLDDARDEGQVRDLIPGNPACGVLITARERLPDLDGAHHLPPLVPLEPPESTELFRRLIRRSGIDPAAEPEATRRVVDLCAGLPLALFIAGALRGRDRDRSTADVAERLARQPLCAFVYGDRSVERSIGAGFDRLDGEAQRLFLGLGLVRLPDFGPWTAAAVLGDAVADPAEVLVRLAGCHMLQSAGPGLRYRFHDLTREYARGRAEAHYAAPAERHAILGRVYGALLTLARRAHRGVMYGGDFEIVHGTTPGWDAPEDVMAELARAPLDWYEAERENIRAAVRHAADLGYAELCWDLAVSAHEFYGIRNYHDDWHDTHRVALSACRLAGNLRGEATLLAMLGQPALVASRRAGVSTLEELVRAVQIFEDLGDTQGRAIALRTLANGLRRRGQLDRALAMFGQALALYEASGDMVGRWQALRYTGQTQIDLGRADAALGTLSDAERVARDAGGPRIRAQTDYWIGQALLHKGDLPLARRSFQAVLDAVSASDPSGLAYGTHGMGQVSLLAGDLPAAERELRHAVEHARVAGDGVLEGRACCSLADLYGAQGRPDEQVVALTRALARFSSHNAIYLEARTRWQLGRLHARLGATEAARDELFAARELYREMGLSEEADAVRDDLNGLTWNGGGNGHRGLR